MSVMVAGNERNATRQTLKEGERRGDAGAGRSTRLDCVKSKGKGDSNASQHETMGKPERTFSAASTFLSGALAISASQLIGAPLKFVDPKFYNEYMAWTKESFAVLVTTITQFWAPTVVRVSGDDSMKGQLYQMDDGTLRCNLPHRLILMANHQLYTDWLYLWWIGYTNKTHGHIYIILKESLKNLPIFGWGAQFYNFIFLSRKWETDQKRFKKALDHLQDPKDPMWLLIFPEGTNLSAVTREKSAAWSRKSGIQDMKHQLLPRSTGLRYCLQELHKTTNWLYDCTLAYEGVPDGMYGQDIYTLRSSFFEGSPPKSVNLFWRRFKISEIPYGNDEAFSRWLTNRWREKDYILEYFFRFGSFPNGNISRTVAVLEGKQAPVHRKMIVTEVKGGGWDEFLKIFGPLTSLTDTLCGVDMTEPLDFDSLLAKAVNSQSLALQHLGKAPIPAAGQEAIRKALIMVNKQRLQPNDVKKLLTDTAQTEQGLKQVARKAVDVPARASVKDSRTPKFISGDAKGGGRASSTSFKPLTTRSNEGRRGSGVDSRPDHITRTLTGAAQRQKLEGVVPSRHTATFSVQSGDLSKQVSGGKPARVMSNVVHVVP